MLSVVWLVNIVLKERGPDENKQSSKGLELPSLTC